MTVEPPAGQDDLPVAATTAVLFPRRGPGVGYGVVTGLVAILDVLGIQNAVAGDRYAFAAILLVLGVGAVAFLAMLSLAILVPRLELDEARVRGRLSLRTRVDVDWEDVTVDVDEDSPRGRFRLDLGAESIAVDIRSWVGFRDFALLIASTRRPASRLTPVARREVTRLFQLEDPSAAP